MQVKEVHGNYVCLKHNQIILLIVMDKRVLPENQMLCNICMSENRLPLNQVLSVQQAKEMIKEKLMQQNAGHSERITKRLEQLRLLQSNIIELRQQLLFNIEAITRMIDYWGNELSNSMTIDSIDLIKGLQQQYDQGQTQNLIEQNNKTYLIKIYSAFKKLLKIDGIQKCFQDLQNIVNQAKPIQQKQSKQIMTINHGHISYQMINQVKQREDSNAIAFNSTGNIMISGFGKDIKVWQFEKGDMSTLTVLKGQGNWISCLLFSRKNSWFISGDGGGIIKCWKQGKCHKEWLSYQADKKHSDYIRCILLTENDDQIISCSLDKSIIVWRVRNQEIEYQYSLQQIHSWYIQGLSLNQSENALVSYGDDKLFVLWTKGADDKWNYQNSIVFSSCVSRACFIDDIQILVQQDGKGFTNVFQIVNEELKEQEEMKIKLFPPKENFDCSLFPTIYNKNKQIIIQKSHQFVYIIRKNESFKIVEDPIDCQTKDNYGALTEDGEYLVIWDDKSKEFRVYKIHYE